MVNGSEAFNKHSLRADIDVWDLVCLWQLQRGDIVFERIGTLDFFTTPDYRASTSLFHGTSPEVLRRLVCGQEFALSDISSHSQFRQGVWGLYVRDGYQADEIAARANFYHRGVRSSRNVEGWQLLTLIFTCQNIAQAKLSRGEKAGKQYIGTSPVLVGVAVSTESPARFATPGVLLSKQNAQFLLSNNERTLQVHFPGRDLPIPCPEFPKLWCEQSLMDIMPVLEYYSTVASPVPGTFRIRNLHTYIFVLLYELTFSVNAAHPLFLVPRTA